MQTDSFNWKVPSMNNLIAQNRPAFKKFINYGENEWDFYLFNATVAFYTTCNLLESIKSKYWLFENK